MNKVLDKENNFLIDIGDKKVTQLRIDISLTLVFLNKAESIEISLMTKFVYKNSKGKRFTIDPERTLELSNTLDLLHKQGDCVSIDKKNSSMIIQFNDHSVIEILPDNNYEAWTISGTGGINIVCTPGEGEPSIFKNK